MLPKAGSRTPVDFDSVNEDIGDAIPIPIGKKDCISVLQENDAGGPAQNLYDFLLGQAQTRTAAGWVFESRIHRIFENDSGSRLNLVTKAEDALTFDKAADLGHVFAPGEIFTGRQCGPLWHLPI
jgi:hypothetical protein